MARRRGRHAQCAEQPDTVERRHCVEERIDLENLFGPRFNPSYFHLRGKGPVGAALKRSRFERSKTFTADLLGTMRLRDRTVAVTMGLAVVASLN